LVDFDGRLHEKVEKHDEILAWAITDGSMRQSHNCIVHTVIFAVQFSSVLYRLSSKVEEKEFYFKATY
jgi:hypothetical protein